MRYYLFDFDGTICDSKEGILNAVEYTLKTMNIQSCLSRDEMEPIFIGPPLTESLPKLVGNNTDTIIEAIKTFREYYNSRGTYENSIYDGINSMLDVLTKRGAQLYIASSKPTKFINLILKKHGIDHYFKNVFSPTLDEDNLTKYDIIMRAKNEIFSKEQSPVIYMIGDRKYDIEGAHMASIPCIGVNWGTAERGELVEYGADYIVDTPLEILDIDMQITHIQEHK